MTKSSSTHESTVRAFGYIRLSKEDRDSTSPQRQRQRIERLCQERGWDLLELFEDIDVSAFKGKRRPAFTRMMGRLDEVGAVVFWRLDRLSRSVLDFSRILEQTQAADVQLVSTDQPIDTSSAMGTAFVQISSVFAQLEAGTLSERSRQMHAFKRERGEPTGRVPYGWRRNGKGFEADPEQQATLAEAARRYIAGDTFNGIAKDLGFSAAGPLSRMLYSERVQEALPPELSGKLAAALLSRKWERVPRSRLSLLGGIATCGVCGSTMTATSTRANRKGRWYSYGCRTAGHVHISAPWLDRYVSERVIQMVDTGRLMAELKRRRKVAKPRQASELEARLELLEQSFYVEGKITAARFQRVRDSLLDRLAKARREEREAGVDLPSELAHDLAERWETLPVAQRRQVITAVLQRVDVAKANGNGAVDPSRVGLVWRVQIQPGV